MGIDNDQLIDLVRTTLKDLPKGQFEMAWDSQEFEFCRIYAQNRRKIDGGTSIQRAGRSRQQRDAPATGQSHIDRRACGAKFDRPADRDHSPNRSAERRLLDSDSARRRERRG